MSAIALPHVYTRRWISPQTAGERVGISAKRIKRLCRLHGLPHSTASSGRIRVDAKALAGWWERHKPTADPKPWKKAPSDHWGDSAGGVVYALTDPRPEKIGQVRYIGKSANLSKRRRDYLADFRRGRAHNPGLRRWVAKLNALGLVPGFKVLEECLLGLNALEQRWIEKGRADGWPLLNCARGGIGGPRSDEYRRQQSERGKAKWQDPAYIARWEAAQAVRWGFPSVEAWKSRRAQPSQECPQSRQDAPRATIAIGRDILHAATGSAMGLA